jgi:hypothetical protein
MKILCLMAACLCVAGSATAQIFPTVDLLPSQSKLPDPLVSFNGSPVTTAAQWTEQRRPELMRLFQHYMYGYFPTEKVGIKSKVESVDAHALNNTATMKQITISFDASDLPAIHLLLVVPNQRTKPAPVFLGLNFEGNYTVLPDPSIIMPTNWMPNNKFITNNQANSAARGAYAESWAIDQSINRGYAVATFYYGDIDPDKPDFTDGVHPHFHPNSGGKRTAQEWGSIADWAWGLHRAVDYLYTDSDIDTNRLAVFGHSRNGKAALLAGAFDERIKLVIPHQAGCGGSAPSRGKIGESVQRINTVFPHWFSDTFHQFNERPEQLPFDQHELIAICAPRPVLLSNATEDTWANPEGQFEMLLAANPVYKLLGVTGITATKQPPVGQLLDSRLGYFIRPGKHSTTRADWKTFLDFADQNLR